MQYRVSIIKKRSYKSEKTPCCTLILNVPTYLLYSVNEMFVFVTRNEGEYRIYTKSAMPIIQIYTHIYTSL